MSHRRSPRPLVLLAAVVTGLVLGACGSGDDDAEPTTATTAETASSADEVDDAGGEASCPDDADIAAAVGAEVALDPSSNRADGCNYYGETGTPDAEVSVNVLVEQPTAQTIEDVERNLGVDRVEGVGDAAWEMVTPGGIVQFGAFEADRYVTVTISGASDDPAIGRAVYELVP